MKVAPVRSRRLTFCARSFTHSSPAGSRTASSIPCRFLKGYSQSLNPDRPSNASVDSTGTLRRDTSDDDARAPGAALRVQNQVKTR